jgi:hypothetical protein
MSRRTLPTALTAVVFLSALASVIFGQDNPQPDTRSHRPILISPGGQNHEGQVGNGCPTFSWTLLAEAEGYEFRVYELNAIDDAPPPTAEPRLRKQFPEGAASWTPETPECLPAGRYAWAVATLGGDGPPRWSLPGRFRVNATPPPARQEPRRRDESMASGVVTTIPPPLEAGSLGTGITRLAADAYTPPVCGAGRFADVPPGSAFCRWIEQLDRDGIMTSCDGGSNFCPKNPVTREQLAMVLGRSTRSTATWHPAQGSNWLAPPVGNVVTTVDDVGDVGQYTSITIGVDGLPIMSYADITVESLKVAHCNDIACAGPATITTVDNDGNLGGYSSIAIGTDGLPVISYYDTTIDFDSGFDRRALKVAHCNDVACSGQDETITIVHDVDTAVGLYTSIAIGADGFPIISHRDDNLGTLLVTHCNDVACAPGGETTTTVDPGPMVGQYTSIAIGADGLPIISYYEAFAGANNVGQALKVAHCNDLACSGQDESHSRLYDGVQTTGLHTSIAIGVDGLPIISHIDQGGPVLVVTHCNDFPCDPNFDDTSVNIQGTLGVTGESTSITIGADGLPVISYYDGVAHSLRVVHCNGGLYTPCEVFEGGAASDFATVTTLDTNFVGRFSSITIGVDGLPIMSYYDAANGALKVAHCSNVFCTPYFRRR